MSSRTRKQRRRDLERDLTHVRKTFRDIDKEAIKKAVESVQSTAFAAELVVSTLNKYVSLAEELQAEKNRRLAGAGVEPEAVDTDKVTTAARPVGRFAFWRLTRQPTREQVRVAFDRALAKLWPIVIERETHSHSKQRGFTWRKTLDNYSPRSKAEIGTLVRYRGDKKHYLRFMKRSSMSQAQTLNEQQKRLIDKLEEEFGHEWVESMMLRLKDRYGHGYDYTRYSLSYGGVVPYGRRPRRSPWL